MPKITKNFIYLVLSEKGGFISVPEIKAEVVDFLGMTPDTVVQDIMDILEEGLKNGDFEEQDGRYKFIRFFQGGSAEKAESEIETEIAVKKPDNQGPFYKRPTCFAEVEQEMRDKTIPNLPVRTGGIAQVIRGPFPPLASIPLDRLLSSHLRDHRVRDFLASVPSVELPGKRPTYHVRTPPTSTESEDIVARVLMEVPNTGTRWVLRTLNPGDSVWTQDGGSNPTNIDGSNVLQIMAPKPSTVVKEDQGGSQPQEQQPQEQQSQEPQQQPQEQQPQEQQPQEPQQQPQEQQPQEQQQEQGAESKEASDGGAQKRAAQNDDSPSKKLKLDE